MEITDELIDHLAKLSRLRFEGDERASIKRDLGRMLEFVDKLKEVDVANEEPLKYITQTFQSLRRDEVHQTVSHQQALQNAPSKDSDYFKVPKVLKN